MTQTADIRQYSFRNDSGHTVPPYGVMAVTDTIVEQNEIIYLIRRPTYADEQLQDPARLVINLGEYVTNGEKGRCTSSMPVQALCLATTVLGDTVGPVEDSFVLGNTGIAFIAKTRDNTYPHVEGSSETWMIEINVSEVEVVLVTSNTRDADGYYPGSVQRFDTASKTWFTVRSCRVRDVNG
jgi:hypothetical protein